MSHTLKKNTHYFVQLETKSSTQMKWQIYVHTTKVDTIRVDILTLDRIDIFVADYTVFSEITVN